MQFKVKQGWNAEEIGIMHNEFNNPVMTYLNIDKSLRGFYVIK